MNRIVPKLCIAIAAVLLAAGTRARAAEPEQAWDAPPVATASVTARGEDAPSARLDASRGNPLWAVPLESLSATRERPLFAPSRRRPATPLAAPPPSAAPPPPPPPARPTLTLIGTVVGPVESLGIFLDPATKTVLRLKTGDAHDGWTLREVGPRSVTLRSSTASATLALPSRQASDTAPPPPRGAAGTVVAGRAPPPTPQAHDVVVPRRAPKTPLESYPDH